MESIKQHEFRADWVNDEHGIAVMLTQSDGYCEPQTVLVHPWQLRATCEKFNILPTGDEQAHRAIASLSRRLRVLAGRISDLRAYVATYSDHAHADLHAEMVMLGALDDLASEWAEEAGQFVGSSSEPVQSAPEAPRSAETESAKGLAPTKSKKRPEPPPANDQRALELAAGDARPR